jgi:regulator of RNase E activity RraB
MSPVPIQVVSPGEWDMFIARTEAGPVFVTFDVEVARHPPIITLPHCARVIIRIQKPAPTGAPYFEEAQRLDVAEQALCSELGAAGVPCRLVGRLTHEGVRESVFQLSEMGPFRNVVERWWQKFPDEQIRVVTHPGWQFYEACIRPTVAQWQWMRDRRVVDTLIGRGSDPAKEHTLKFFFGGPPAGLRNLEEELRTRGYAPSPADSSEGKLVMVLRSRLDTDFIAGQSLALEDLTRAYGVAYEGWGAHVVKRDPTPE